MQARKAAADAGKKSFKYTTKDGETRKYELVEGKKGAKIYKCVENCAEKKKRSPRRKKSSRKKSLRRRSSKKGNECGPYQYRKKITDKNGRVSHRCVNRKRMAPKNREGLAAFGLGGGASAPKRPPTAFFLYAQTRRAAFKRDYPNESARNIAAAMGKEWRNMSNAKKDKFYAEAAKAKAKYEKEKAKYDAKKSKNGPPKRPPTSYFLFSQDRRPELKREHPNLSVTKIAIKLGEEWRNMGDKKRRTYEKEAARLKKIYDREKAAFDLGGGGNCDDE